MSAARPARVLEAPVAVPAVARPVPQRYARQWLGGVRLGPIEAIASLQPLDVTASPTRRIHARVGDTSAILSELVQSVRRPKPIALMTTMRDGGLRLYVAPTVLEEVPEKILEDPAMQRRFARNGITRDAVLDRWRTALLPYVRVVEVGPIDRLELAGVPDEDDLPTAQLAAILGPRSAWSSDPHLTVPGLAVPYDEHVLRLVIAIREVCLIDVEVVTASQSAELVARIGAELVAAIARLDGRGRLLAGTFAVVALGAIGFALYKRPHLREVCAEALRRISEGVVAEIQRGYKLREEWVDRVPPPLAIESSRNERAIARVLACASAPLTPREVGQVLSANGTPRPTDQIVKELRSHAMFVPVGSDLWQLGRHWRA